MFYADKTHLQRYGRPITGDVYIAMTYGPVPSGVYNLLKHEPFLPPDILEKLDESLGIVRPRVRAKRLVREDQFSGSDLRILEEAFQRYSHVPFGDLSDLSHRERAYIEAAMAEENRKKGPLLPTVRARIKINADAHDLLKPAHRDAILNNL